MHIDEGKNNRSASGQNSIFLHVALRLAVKKEQVIVTVV